MRLERLSKSHARTRRGGKHKKVGAQSSARRLGFANLGAHSPRRASCVTRPTKRGSWRLRLLMRLFLCGDVMTGRGIDQAMPHPVNPVLHEPYVRDARDYIALAENTHGPIPRPLPFDYIWGDALQELDRAAVDFRIVILETAISSSETAWPVKGIYYCMHPHNAGF